MVNLVADLGSPQIAPKVCARAQKAAVQAGYTLAAASNGRLLAWIDEMFGGSWSSEAFAGKTVVATRGQRLCGFATHGAHMSYCWLRGLGAQRDVGIFGPFGVAPEDRGSPLGPALLLTALDALRRDGYARALIPAVGDEKLVRYYAQHAGAIVAERYPLLEGGKQYRTLVLASGYGSNFQAVIDAIAHEGLPLDIVLLLSNNPTAFALERARTAGIETALCVWERATQSREAHDVALLETAQRAQPQLVLLLGWMHLLHPRFVEAFPEMLNVHPGFLPLDENCDEVTFPDGAVTPAFRGARAVRDALTWGAHWVGASVHRVTAQTDRGPVLARSPLRVRAGEDEAMVLERLHPLEHRVLRSALRRWLYER